MSALKLTTPSAIRDKRPARFTAIVASHFFNSQEILMPLVPYLNFNGNCAEAMAFYAEAAMIKVDVAAMQG